MQLVSPAPDPEECLILKETWEGALAYLSPREREVLYERAIMGRTYRAVGAIVGRADNRAPLSAERTRQMFSYATRMFWKVHQDGVNPRMFHREPPPIPAAELEFRRARKVDGKLKAYLNWATGRKAAEQRKRWAKSRAFFWRWHDMRTSLAEGLRAGRLPHTAWNISRAVQVCERQIMKDTNTAFFAWPELHWDNGCERCTDRLEAWARWIRDVPKQ